MKIAYIVLTHKDPNLLLRLIKKLTQNKNNYIFIHVDKKIKQEDFSIIKENEQVQFIKNNIAVTWAGYSSIIATINSFKQSINYKEFDRFVILQGLDYPIKTNKYIEQFFIKNKDIEFIGARKDTGMKTEQHKYCLNWYLDKKDLFHTFLNNICKLLTVLKINIKIKKDYIYINNKKYDIFRGGANIALTRNAVNYIIDFYDNNPKFNKYFQTVFASDESYFHTVLYNNNDFKILNHDLYKKDSCFFNLTYYEYLTVARIFKTPEDIKELDLNNYLYIRKVTSNDSKELLDYLDEKNKD